MTKHHKVKFNIPMCSAVVLLCLTLFSCHLCGGLYAKYVTTDRGNDAAGVARFDISEDGAYFSEDLLFETAPGSVEREIIVTNNSEVAVSYDVTIKNATQNIPYSFSINGSPLSMNECSITCQLEPNSQNNLKVVAQWDEEGALEYMGMVDLIKLTINARQLN